MFDSLSHKFSNILNKITGRTITEAQILSVIEEIRTALLEADVALPVLEDLVKELTADLIGGERLRSVTAAQQIIKSVHDRLTEILGGASRPFEPSVGAIMMLGLQGVGKTTSSVKLGYGLKAKGRKPLLVSLDVYRPAAKEQLRSAAEVAGVPVLEEVLGEKPEDTVRRALKERNYDIVIFDTAGRLNVDDAMLNELVRIEAIIGKAEKLLVLDCMSGQNALVMAEDFQRSVGVTGVILTRADSDARAGAVLSVYRVLGCPIYFVGTGERFHDWEVFHPDRIAGRMLGMGDIVSLVEKAARLQDAEDLKKTESKLVQGHFDFNDLLQQFKKLRQSGGIRSMVKFLPVAFKDKLESQTHAIKKQEAIILSMTPKERTHPDLILMSRKKRIAQGAGVTVSDVNRLMKQYEQMARMMKKLGKGGQLDMEKLGAMLPPELRDLV